MKKNIYLFTLLIILSVGQQLAGCHSGSSEKAMQKATAPAPSPTALLDGSWELVSEMIGDPALTKGKSIQFKMFHDGFFSMIMQDSSGKLSLAGAGTCSLEGNNYQETFKYCNLPEYVGVSDSQEMEIRGDTMYTKGFTRVVFPGGVDKTAGFPKFEEKRIRARR